MCVLLFAEACMLPSFGTGIVGADSIFEACVVGAVLPEGVSCSVECAKGYTASDGGGEFNTAFKCSSGYLYPPHLICTGECPTASVRLIGGGLPFCLVLPLKVRQPTIPRQTSLMACSRSDHCVTSCQNPKS